MSDWSGKCETCGAPARRDDDPDGSGVKFDPGYTRADIAEIRRAANGKQEMLSDFAKSGDVTSSPARRLFRLADRLEAMLPAE